MNPYRPPKALVVQAERSRESRTEPRHDRIFAIAVFPWLVLLITTGAVHLGILDGALMAPSWLPFLKPEIDILAPGYGLLVAVPALLLVAAEWRNATPTLTLRLALASS